MIPVLLLSHCAERKKTDPPAKSLPSAFVPVPNSPAGPGASVSQGGAVPVHSAAALAYVPNTIRCGTKLCNTTTETCCMYSDEGACRNREPLANLADVSQRTQQQVAACTNSPPSDLSLSEFRTCDDSTDCPGTNLCCAHWLWSGASYNACVPGAADGKNACELSEPCVVDDNCRTPNTSCRAGKCVLKNAKIRCGGTICQGATPACCRTAFEGPPTCVAEKDCVSPVNNENGPFPIRQECSGPSTCPKGMICQLGLVDTYCTGMRDGANSSLVCDTVKDCSIEECRSMGNKGPVKCEMDRERGFSICVCH